jgi:uncharacterized protein
MGGSMPRVDPRPLVEDGRLRGARCVACRYPLAFPRPHCPLCGDETAPETFGPAGHVWASTVVRVAVPGRRPPYGLAYVDLDDGPRVLAQVADADDAVAIGARVQLVDTPSADVVVAVEP